MLQPMEAALVLILTLPYQEDKGLKKFEDELKAKTSDRCLACDGSGKITAETAQALTFETDCIICNAGKNKVSRQLLSPRQLLEIQKQSDALFHPTATGKVQPLIFGKVKTGDLSGRQASIELETGVLEKVVCTLFLQSTSAAKLSPGDLVAIQAPLFDPTAGRKIGGALLSNARIVLIKKKE